MHTAQIATAGGTRGAGMAALAKLAAVCVGTVGGAAACVATGVVPAPLGLAADQKQAPRLERQVASPGEADAELETGVDYEPEQPAPVKEEESPSRQHDSAPPSEEAPPPAPEASSGAVEYAPPPAASPSTSSPPAASAPNVSGSSGGGGAAGEFGP